MKNPNASQVIHHPKPPSFLRKFRQHGMQVAMLRPSSSFLARAHCAHVTPDRPQIIVELGAGTGPVTEAICARMHAESRLFALEIDPEFAVVLRERCPRATVLVEDAGNLIDIATRYAWERIDLMISCLALPYIPRRAVAAIFGAFSALGEQGWFTQQTLVPLVYRRMYTRLFEEVHFRPVARNLPPGGVYHCRGLRPNYRAYLPGKRVAS